MWKVIDFVSDIKLKSIKKIFYLLWEVFSFFEAYLRLEVIHHVCKKRFWSSKKTVILNTPSLITQWASHLTEISRSCSKRGTLCKYKTFLMQKHFLSVKDIIISTHKIIQFPDTIKKIKEVDNIYGELFTIFDHILLLCKNNGTRKWL